MFKIFKMPTPGIKSHLLLFISIIVLMISVQTSLIISPNYAIAAAEQSAEPEILDLAELNSKKVQVQQIYSDLQRLVKLNENSSHTFSPPTLNVSDTTDSKIDISSNEFFPGFVIKRTYFKSLQNEQSFGKGWVSNLDTRIILGVLPHYKEKYEKIQNYLIQIDEIYYSLNLGNGDTEKTRASETNKDLAEGNTVSDLVLDPKSNPYPNPNLSSDSYSDSESVLDSGLESKSDSNYDFDPNTYPGSGSDPKEIGQSQYHDETQYILDEIQNIRNKVLEIYQQIEKEYEYSRFAHYYNLGNIDWSINPELENIGIDRLLFIDENGGFHFYKIENTPDYNSDYRTYEGFKNYYPAGAKATPENGDMPEIEILPDGSYRLEKNDGKVYTYSHFGRLKNIQTTDGNELDFEYNPDRELVKIEDSLNRTITIKREKGRIVQISDFTGETVSYNYDQGYLVEFKGTSGKTEKYTPVDYGIQGQNSINVAPSNIMVPHSCENHQWEILRDWVEPREYTDSSHKVYGGKKCVICDKRVTWFERWEPHDTSGGSWTPDNDSTHSQVITCSECNWRKEKTEEHDYHYSSGKDICSVCNHSRPNPSYEASEEGEQYVSEGESYLSSAGTHASNASSSVNSSEQKKGTAESDYGTAQTGYNNGDQKNADSAACEGVANSYTSDSLGDSAQADQNNNNAQADINNSTGEQNSSEENIEQLEDTYGAGTKTNNSATGLQYDNLQLEDENTLTTDGETLETNGETAGDPVRYTTGEYVSKSTDLKITALDPAITIVRTYGSFNQSSHSFGKGWSFNYDTRVIIGVRPDFKEVAERLEDYANELKRQYNDAVAEYNSALAHANNAVERAEDSVEHAKDAVDNAEKAKTLAENAVQKAEEAKELSDEAKDILDDAYTELNQAIANANEARNAARQAEQEGEAGIDAAEDAISKAERAISEAENAKSLADGNSTLISKANAVISQAQALKADAEDVKRTAEDARNRAITLQNELDTLSGELNQLESDISRAQNRAEDNYQNARNALDNAEDALELAKEMVQKTNRTLELARNRLKNAKDWLREVKASYILVEELREMKEEVEELSAKAQLDREYSEVARYRNQYNVDWSNAPDKDEVGIQKLILIDESGAPHIYRMTTAPDHQSQVKYPDGKKNYYPAGAVTVPDEPTDDTLELLSDGSYRLTKKDKTVYTYSYFGKLTEICEPNGRYLQFTYNDSQELIAITDQFNRTVQLERANGRIRKINDPIGRVHRYDYNNDCLTAYTDPAGYTRSYMYNSHGLSEVRYPDGSGWKYYYTILDGRSVMDYQVDSSGALIDFHYSPDRKETIVTDRCGHDTTYFFNERHLTGEVLNPDYTREQKVYDAEDNLIATTDEKGNTTSYTYDENRNITSITDAKGYTITFTYNEMNKVTSITDRNGYTTYYEYDPKGNLVSIMYPDGTSQSFTYNQSGLLKTVRDQRGNLTQYNYDEYGYPTEKISPDGTREQYIYNRVGQLLKLIRPNGGEINYTYDDNGRVTAVTDEPGFVTEYKYNPRGEIAELVDPNGNVYTYRYDNRNKLAEIIDPEGNVKKFEYDGEENLIKEVLAENISYVYRYDDLNRLIASTQVETGITVQYEYDAVSNLTGIIDGEGRKYQYIYDELNRKIKEIDPLNQAVYYEYLPGNQLKSVTDKKGYKTEFEYDAMGRLTKVTNALGHTVNYEYDAAGNLIRFKDPKGLETNFVYDVENRLIKKIDPEGGETVYEYDLVGNLTKVIDPEGNQIQYVYDLKGRLIKEINALGDAKVYEYDPAGNIISLTDESGAKTTYSYDRLNRLIGIENAPGNKTKLGYNPSGQIIWQEDALGNRVEYEYDALGQLITITDAEGYKIHYEYDRAGNLINEKDQMGNITRYKYDELNRLVEVIDALNQSIKYEYDANNNMIKLINGNDGVYEYQYDILNRPVAEIDYLGNRQSYEYDPNNNLIKKIDFNGNTTDYNYDNLNRLLEITFADDSSKSFEYDRLGNLIKAANQNSVERFYYDELSRLIKVEVDKLNEPEENNWIINYSYNAVGKRTNISVKGMESEARETTCQYDELNRLIEVGLPDGGKIEFKYDELNRIVEEINANKTGTGYSYTPRGQVEKIIHFKETVGIKEVLDSYGYIYNPKGQRIYEVKGDTEVRAFEYDPIGRIKKVYYPFEDTKKLEDLKERHYYGLLPAVTEPADYELEFYHTLSFDEELNLNQQLQEYLGELDITGEFGTVDRLTLTRGAHALPLPDYLTLNDADYNRLNDLYNDIRMDSWEAFDPEDESYWTEEFTYDANGNIISKQNGWGEILYRYNKNNQLIQAGNRTYSYDLNGNLITEGMGTFKAEYVYNYENRLTKATNLKYANFYNGDKPFFGEITFTHDALGRKIEKVADPLKKPQVETTRYLYDGLGVNVLTEYQMLSWENDNWDKNHGNGNQTGLDPEVFVNGLLANGSGKGKTPDNPGNGPKPKKPGEDLPGDGGYPGGGIPFRDGGKLSKYNEYYYGNNTLLAMRHSIDPSQGNGYGVNPDPKVDVVYYHRDVLGSIVLMTGEHGQPVERYEYDVFGHPYEGHFLHNPNNNNPYGFTGQRYEPELGVYAFAYRHYNPHSMRWMTVDPVKDGVNWYQYCGGDPVNFVDLLGLEMEESTYWDRTGDYLWKSGKQILLGNYSEDVTLLGTLGEIGVGFTGIDFLGDLRDVSADIKDWKWTWGHAGQTLLDGVGLIPVVGVIKNVDEVGTVVKRGWNSVVKGFKSLFGSSGEIKRGVKGTIESGTDIIEGVGKSIPGNPGLVKDNKLTGNKKIYYDSTGKFPNGEVHHALPRQFADYFDEVGLDVNSSEFLYDIPKEVHRLKPDGLHTKTNVFGKTWNKVWQEFFAQNPNFTRDDVLKQLEKMIKETGLDKYK